MGQFCSWSDWLDLQESKSNKKRKRKKNRNGLFLRSFYNFDQESNNFEDNVSDSGDSGGVSESKKTIQNPDYSFDSWLKKVEKLGKDVNKIINQGKKKDQEIEKKKKDLEKDTKKNKIQTSKKTKDLTKKDKEDNYDDNKDKKSKK